MVYHVLLLSSMAFNWTLGTNNEGIAGRIIHGCGPRPEPSATIIDSQSIKTDPNPSPCGYDMGKKVKDRKRHILVDTLGFILVAIVYVANIQD